MPTPDERITQFIAAWEQEFGDALTEAEARATLARLIELYRLMLRPALAESVTGARDIATPAKLPSSDPPIFPQAA